MALDANAITTVALAKTFMGVTGSTNDTLIESLINGWTARMEAIAHRRFAAREYREWLTPGVDLTVIVRNNPLIEVERVAFGSAEALTAQYTGSDIRAELQITPLSIIVKSYSSAGAESGSTLTFALNLTASAMATAITAVSDWTGTLTNDAMIEDLFREGSKDAKTPGIVSVRYPDQYADIEMVDYDCGVIHLHGQHSRVLVEYRGGYENVQTGTGDVADLRMLCEEFVAESFQLRKLNTALSSESLGDYSYSMVAGVQLTEDQRARLMHWSNVGVAA